MEDKGIKMAKKPSSSKTKSAAKSAAKPAAKSNAAAGFSLPKQIDFVWAIALVVIAFVVGFLIRGLFPANNNTALTSSVPGYSSGLGSSNAPALSPEQMQKGQLPEGHPNIGGGSSQTGAGHAGTGQTGNGQTPAQPSVNKVNSDVPAAGDVPSGKQSVTPPEDKK